MSTQENVSQFIDLQCDFVCPSEKSAVPTFLLYEMFCWWNGWDTNTKNYDYYRFWRMLEVSGCSMGWDPIHSGYIKDAKLDMGFGLPCLLKEFMKVHCVRDMHGQSVEIDWLHFMFGMWLKESDKKNCGVEIFRTILKWAGYTVTKDDNNGPDIVSGLRFNLNYGKLKQFKEFISAQYVPDTEHSEPVERLTLLWNWWLQSTGQKELPNLCANFYRNLCSIEGLTEGTYEEGPPQRIAGLRLNPGFGACKVCRDFVAHQCEDAPGEAVPLMTLFAKNDFTKISYAIFMHSVDFELDGSGQRVIPNLRIKNV